MAKLVHWDAETAKRELSKRMANATDARKKYERDWEQNERAIFATSATQPLSGDGLLAGASGTVSLNPVTGGGPDYTINYAFKNYRLIHSQLAANPPTVVPRPTSNDPSDRRKADAADRLIRYALRQYDLKEVFDRCTSLALLHGTSFIRSYWDPEKGEIEGFDPETQEVETEGDMCFKPVSSWDMFLDPDARCWEDVTWVFQRILLPYEEACFRFPEYKELLDKLRIQQDNRASTSTQAMLRQQHFDIVELFQYWETGRPYNGYMGRFCWCTMEGDVLGEITPNPVRFSSPVDGGINHPESSKVDKPERPGKAKLPFDIFTDIDLPETSWGKASTAYQAPLQALHNDLLNASVDMVEAHGVARIILPEGSEIADGSITNSNWDIIKTTGSQSPHFMPPLPMPPALPEMLGIAKAGIDDMAGVNESMFGQQSREQSGFSMQYATQQANMIRHRLFIKYTRLTENVYKNYLNMVRKYWQIPRTINVLGKEKAFEAYDIQGADIDGGFDIVAEYGTSLSLDPMTRRQEIIQMMPVLEKAGIETRAILQMMKLNELDGLYDRVQMASDRQREIFEKMTNQNIYVEPRELSDHKSMLAYAYDFIMSSEFSFLTEEHKQLIEKHIHAREQFAAQGPAAGAQAAGGMPGAEPQPGGNASAPQPGAPASPSPQVGAASMAPAGGPPQ